MDVTLQLRNLRHRCDSNHQFIQAALFPDEAIYSFISQFLDYIMLMIRGESHARPVILKVLSFQTHITWNRKLDRRTGQTAEYAQKQIREATEAGALVP